MPSITVAGVRDAGAPVAADAAAGIDQTVVLDVTGKQYDVFASSTEAGRKRLAGRVRAARTLADSREPGGMGFALDHVISFQDGADGKGSTGLTAVMIIAHHDGVARNLDLLTLDDCSAMGTAIGAIHRLPASITQSGDYPSFGTAQIHTQLTGWIARLRSAGHIPPEITSSWARIIDTEGLWTFNTCFVHGGFVDGDVLYSGSTITAVTNWQGMQVNDPARDLAWIFAKLDEEHRNAVLAAYGRMMGSRLDDLIMLRANLWLQMEQVGDFIQALNHADNVKIMQFKAQVDRLAHQLGVVTRFGGSGSNAGATAANGNAEAPDSHRSDGAGYRSPSTITVGTLLNESERRLAQAARQQAPSSPAAAPQEDPDATGDMDRTGSASVNRVLTRNADGSVPASSDPDSTEDRTPTSMPRSETPSSTPTQAISPAEARAMFQSFPADTSDTTASRPIAATANDHAAAADGHRFESTDAGSDESSSTSPVDALLDEQPYSYRSQPYRDRLRPEADRQHEQEAQTVLIPLLEQEERALRDARIGLASRTDVTKAVTNGATPSAETSSAETPSGAAGRSDPHDDRDTPTA